MEELRHVKHFSFKASKVDHYIQTKVCEKMLQEFERKLRVSCECPCIHMLSLFKYDLEDKSDV